MDQYKQGPGGDEVDLVRFHREEILDVLVRDLVGGCAKLREKEERLGEVLILEMQGKKEVTSAIEKIGDILKRRDTGHVEVLDTLKKLRSMLRIIEEGGG